LLAKIPGVPQMLPQSHAAPKELRDRRALRLDRGAGRSARKSGKGLAVIWRDRGALQGWTSLLEFLPAEGRQAEPLLGADWLAGGPAESVQPLAVEGDCAMRVLENPLQLLELVPTHHLGRPPLAPLELEKHSQHAGGGRRRNGRPTDAGDHRL